jgi:hypothetical protein
MPKIVISVLMYHCRKPTDDTEPFCFWQADNFLNDW